MHFFDVFRPLFIAYIVYHGYVAMKPVESWRVKFKMYTWYIPSIYFEFDPPTGFIAQSVAYSPLNWYVSI